MKKVMFSFLALAFGALAVQAQEIPERKHDEFRPHEKHRMMGKKELAGLDLTEDQKSKFKALNEDHRKKMEALQKQDNITVKESRERMEALRNEHKNAVQSILTAEQKSKLEKSKVDRDERMKEMGKKHGERMKAELNLTDEQSAKLDANRKAMGDKMKAINENSKLSAEEKKTQMRELRKQQKESLESILTKEQLEKMKEKRKRPASKKDVI